MKRQKCCMPKCKNRVHGVRDPDGEKGARIILCLLCRPCCDRGFRKRSKS